MSPVEIILHCLLFLAGALFFAQTVRAVVNSMLVPRPTRSWIAHWANKATNAIFRFLANRKKTYEGRDAMLAACGPTFILVQLLAFLLGFYLALTMMVVAVSNLGWGKSFFQAGSTLLTLGFVEPVNPLEVALTLLGALVGLVVVAILIGYLFNLYSAYTPRESQIAKLSLIAGEPAWGPEILCRLHLLAGDQAAFEVEDWVNWTSDIRMAQSSNPVLNHFRSSGARRSWLISLLAVLDAANLRLTTVKDQALNPAMVRLIAEGTETLAVLRGNQMYASGAHWVPVRPSKGRLARGELSAASDGENAVVAAISADARRSHRHRRLPDSGKFLAQVGVTREEWDYARSVMGKAGIELADDTEQAWKDFRAVRLAYASNAYAIAETIYAVPAPWSGPRTPHTETIWPTLATDGLPDQDPGPEPESDSDPRIGQLAQPHPEQASEPAP